jgi:drug/metabolite transporter (DMT)-like permease
MLCTENTADRKKQQKIMSPFVHLYEYDKSYVKQENKMMLWGSVLAISLLTSLYSLSLKSVQKHYINEKKDFFLFSVLLNLFQSIFLLLLPPFGGVHFTLDSIVYGSLSGLLVLANYLLVVRAMSIGPLILTTSLISLYIVVPIFYGLFFWNESLSLSSVIGLVLFFVSIFLVSNATYFEENTVKKIEIRWLVYMLLAFACSGATSIISKQYAIIRLDGNKEFLLASRFSNIILSAALYLLFLSINRSSRRSHTKPGRTYLMLCAAAGATMAGANTLFMRYINASSSSFFFPAIQASGAIMMFIFSILVFRERLSKKALIGFAVSILAIILLSL